jgi:hypothetical protein
MQSWRTRHAYLLHVPLPSICASLEAPSSPSSLKASLAVFCSPLADKSSSNALYRYKLGVRGALWFAWWWKANANDGELQNESSRICVVHQLGVKLDPEQNWTNLISRYKSCRRTALKRLDVARDNSRNSDLVLLLFCGYSVLPILAPVLFFGLLCLCTLGLRCIRFSMTWTQLFQKPLNLRGNTFLREHACVSFEACLSVLPPRRWMLGRAFPDISKKAARTTNETVRLWFNPSQPGSQPPWQRF